MAHAGWGSMRSNIIFLMLGLLWMSSPACMAQDGEFDVKRAKLTPDINFEMDSTKTAVILKR